MLSEIKLKKVLFFIDSILPRFLVKLPYSFAAFIIKNRIGPLSAIWFRNSYIKGNLVFGISDLDISVMIDTFDSSLVNTLKAELKKLKNSFPYMGEVNFNIKDQLIILSPSFNLYEKKRDPKLDQMLKDFCPFGENIEKAVFLLRMLGSDKKNLLMNPIMRQKKWRSHFKELNLEAPTFFEKNVIVETIMALIPLQEDKRNAIDAIELLFSKDYDPEKILFIEKPFLWKFIFPNQYIWNDDLGQEDMRGILESPLRFVCLRQIDWEIWGLNSQLPFLLDQYENIKRHIERLNRVASFLSHEYNLSNRVEALLENARMY